MFRLVVVGALAGVLVVSGSGPTLGAPPEHAMESRADVRTYGKGVGPRSYVEDSRNFFTYVTGSSTSDCGGNVACDIEFANFAVNRTSAETFDAIVGVAGATDGQMANKVGGGLVLYLDSDQSRSGPEYALATLQTTYPLREALASWVYAVNGESWIKTESVGYWLRSDTRWGAFVPWQELGLESARVVVRVDDGEGNFDYTPAAGLTPLIPIAALVAGAPGQPTDVKATSGEGQVTVSWKQPTSAGVSAITSYTVTADPGGRTCASASTSCTVTGLTPGVAYSFEVTATNDQGTGPASGAVEATPSGKVPRPGKVRNLWTFSQPGKGQLVVSWKPPVDTGGVGLMGYQVRVGKKPWRSTSIAIFVISRVKAGQVLTVQVRAVNQSGPGPASKIKGTVR